MIRLRLPARLEHRERVVRAVADVCARAGCRAHEAAVVSAVGEAWNNLCVHGYRGREPGDVLVELRAARGVVRVRMTDDGAVFDPTTAPAAPFALRESGMGIEIMRSARELSYRPGPPNVLCLRTRRAHEPPSGGEGEGR